MKVSIFIADDYPVVRRGLRALLETQPEWQIVGEASNGREAVARVAELCPDLVIMDISMPELNGLDATRLIRKALPETRVLILTGYNTDATMGKALQVGVQGYVFKNDAEADLVAAVKALMKGQDFFPPFKSPHRPNGAALVLTAREAEIVQLLAEGKGNKEVGNILGISSRTVENHRAQIMRRLGLKSSADLIRYAIRNGIIEP